MRKVFVGFRFDEDGSAFPHAAFNMKRARTDLPPLSIVLSRFDRVCDDRWSFRGGGFFFIFFSFYSVLFLRSDLGRRRQ